MAKILLTFLTLFCTNLQAQNFEGAVSMGETRFDLGLSIAVDGAGNAYTTGNFQGTVDFDPGPGVSNLTSQWR